LPVVQATARVGIQYHYWRLLHESLKQDQIDPTVIGRFQVLVLHGNPDGTSDLLVDSTPYRVESIASKVGDSTPKFGQYVAMVNYVGDADFYGADTNRIFPMDVQGEDRQKAYVLADQLGIQPEMAQDVWDSWQSFREMRMFFYCRAFYQVLQKYHFKGQQLNGDQGELSLSPDVINI